MNARLRERIIAGAQARADRGCQVGIDLLREMAANAPEFSVSGDATGKRLLEPKRALLAGMLERLEEVQRDRPAAVAS